MGVAGQSCTGIACRYRLSNRTSKETAPWIAGSVGPLPQRLQSRKSFDSTRTWQVRSGSADGQASKGGSMSSEVADLLKATEALLQNLHASSSDSDAESHQRPERGSSARSPGNSAAAPDGATWTPTTTWDEEGGRMELSCDVNGCSIVPVARGDVRGPADIAGIKSRHKFQLEEGEGWKLGFDGAATDTREFGALVGADSWAIALTQDEYADFVQLLMNLRRSVETLQICGEWGRSSADEAVLELSTERVWMQGRAPQKRLSALQDLWRRGDGGGKVQEAAFALRFMISTPGQREVEAEWSAEVVMRVLQHLDAQGIAGVQVQQTSNARKAVVYDYANAGT